jgi:hypothetical protein
MAEIRATRGLPHRGAHAQVPLALWGGPSSSSSWRSPRSKPAPGNPVPPPPWPVPVPVSNLGRSASGGHTDGAHGLSGRDWGQTVPQFLTVCLTPPRSRPPPWAAATTPPTPVRRPISVHFGVCVPHVCLGYTLVPGVLGCRSPAGGSAVVASAPPPGSGSREGAIR